MSDLERKLMQSRELPTLPEVAQRILELLGDARADASQVTSIFADDPDLSADVVRSCGLVPFADVSGAIQAAFGREGLSAGMLVMPDGGSVLPVVPG